MSTDIWRKDYQEFYKSHREENKTVYNLKWCGKFVEERIAVPVDSKCTLLDVGCGDGVWSIILSDYFDVTGIDNSSEGIANCNLLKDQNNKNVEFLLGDVKELTTKYDYLFCRGPEFFGGYSIESDTFQEFKNIVVKLFKKSLFFIVYSKPPFGQYASESKTSYYHDPDKLVEEFSKYGEVSCTYKDKYIVLEIKK